MYIYTHIIICLLVLNVNCITRLTSLFSFTHFSHVFALASRSGCKNSYGISNIKLFAEIRKNNAPGSLNKGHLRKNCKCGQIGSFQRDGVRDIPVWCCGLIPCDGDQRGVAVD